MKSDFGHDGPPERRKPLRTDDQADNRTLRLTPRQLLRSKGRLGANAAEVAIVWHPLSRVGSIAKRAERWMGLGRLMSVRRQPYAPRRRCFLNVQEHCLEYGGSVVIGWNMLIVPSAYVLAIHHAIWRSERGELVDIGLLDDGDAHARSTFLIDPAPLEFVSAKDGVVWARAKAARCLAIGNSGLSRTLAQRQNDHEAAQQREAFPVLPPFSGQIPIIRGAVGPAKGQLRSSG